MEGDYLIAYTQGYIRGIRNMQKEFDELWKSEPRGIRMRMEATFLASLNRATTTLDKLVAESKPGCHCGGCVDGHA
jgi:hypothetical protein